MKVDVSITVRQTTHIKAVISTIGDSARATIKYPKAVFDESSGRWILRAEVAEIPFTAFASRRRSEQVPGRLVVRRIPDLNPKAVAGQPTLAHLPSNRSRPMMRGSCWPSSRST